MAKKILIIKKNTVIIKNQVVL